MITRYSLEQREDNDDDGSCFKALRRLQSTLMSGLPLKGWRERKGRSRHRKQLELWVRQEVVGVSMAEGHCGQFYAFFGNIQ